MHEVDDGDHDDGEGGPGDEPAATVGAEGGEAEEPGRADEEEAQAIVPRSQPGAVRVEEAADGALRAGWQDLGGREEHEPQVLGEVAGVLEAPVGVVLEVRVEERIEADLCPVEGLVAGVEEMARRGDVVGEEPQDRQAHPEEGRRRPARPGAASADEEEEGEAEGDGEAGRRGEAEEDPGADPDWIEGQGGGEEAPGRPEDVADAERAAPLEARPVGEGAVGRRDGASVGAEGEADGEEGAGDGDEVSEVPGRAEHGGVPEDGPETEEDGRDEAARQAEAEAAEDPEGEGDVEAADGGGNELGVRREPEEGDEGEEDEGGQRREGDEGPTGRRPVGADDGQDVLEVPVRRSPGGLTEDGVADPGLPFEPGRCLPDEVVVAVVPLRVADEVDAEAEGGDEEAAQHWRPDPGGDPPERATGCPRAGGREGSPC